MVSFINSLSLFHPLVKYSNQALFGKCPPEEMAKLNHNIGAISKARWMVAVIACMKAHLYGGQIPYNVLSKKERKGSHIST